MSLSAQDLALYLGCEAHVWRSKGAPHEEIIINGGWIDWYESDDSAFLCKPILRPISDLTDSEWQDYANMPYVMEKTGIAERAQQTMFFIGKRIDLFNWIEKGLAIDATLVKDIK